MDKQALNTQEYVLQNQRATKKEEDKWNPVQGKEEGNHWYKSEIESQHDQSTGLEQKTRGR